jgi:hypothetical protein
MKVFSPIIFLISGSILLMKKTENTFNNLSHNSKPVVVSNVDHLDEKSKTSFI